ncbi:toll/interleukin-1 receptor domain-containing protein [Runella sp.]|uniref:toll/interleukin-1 receptor domain-containing protein n=1 Tax=Runella sp. TaxID=1960881 RepID=UPI003D0CE57B
MTINVDRYLNYLFYVYLDPRKFAAQPLKKHLNRILMNIFLSYNRKNQVFVDEIANKLKSFTIGVTDTLFFDKDELRSGDEWANKIQQALVNSDACVVFIGEDGIGKWQMKRIK